jgi:hypothetical protein
MHTFDKDRLVRQLTALNPIGRTAFALSVATRQLRCFERAAYRHDWEHAAQPRSIAERLWATLLSVGSGRDDWRTEEQLVLSWIPHVEDDDWTFEHAFVQEALSSLVYAIRSLLSSDPQEAAWSASAAYAAVDQATTWFLCIRPDSPMILSHPIVQREFGRQADAIQLLIAGSVLDLRATAFAQELITDDELLVIGQGRQ